MERGSRKKMFFLQPEKSEETSAAAQVADTKEKSKPEVEDCTLEQFPRDVDQVEITLQRLEEQGRRLEENAERLKKTLDRLGFKSAKEDYAKDIEIEPENMEIDEDFTVLEEDKDNGKGKDK